MIKKRLHSSLHDLNAGINEVKNSYQEDPETLKVLNNLTRTIQDALEEPGEVTLDYEKLLPHLKEGIEHFEISHPKLTGLINNVIQSLNALGI